MRDLFKIFIVVFTLIACSDKKVEVKIAQVIKEIKTEVLSENPSIETITDLEKVAELRKSIRQKREADERIMLDSMPIYDRLLLNDSLVYDSAISILLKGSYSTRVELLKNLLINKPSRFKIENDGVQSALLLQLNDTSIEKLAMKAIANLGVNYSSSFESKFLNNPSKLSSKYFYWLGKSGKSLSALNQIENTIKKNQFDKKQLSDIVYGLEYFANSYDKEIKEKAVSVLVLLFKKKFIGAKEINSLTKKENRNNIARSFVKTILKHGNNKAVIGICLKNNLYIKDVFKNLAKNKDPKINNKFVKQISSKKSFLQSLPAAPVVYKSKNDSLIPIQILKAFEKQKEFDSERVHLVYSVFKKMNALNYLKNADKYLKNKELILQLSKIKDQPIVETDYDEMAHSIFKTGLIDSLSHNEIEGIKSEGIYADENAILKNILKNECRLLTIEKLAPSTPIDYGDLFQSFKKSFPNQLKNVEFISEFENKDYAWLIVGSHIGLIAHPRNNNDVYDLELFLSAMNEIKASAKRFQILTENIDAVDVFFGNDSDTQKAKSFLVQAIN